MDLLTNSTSTVSSLVMGELALNLHGRFDLVINDHDFFHLDTKTLKIKDPNLVLRGKTYIITASGCYLFSGTVVDDDMNLFPVEGIPFHLLTIHQIEIVFQNIYTSTVEHNPFELCHESMTPRAFDTSKLIEIDWVGPVPRTVLNFLAGMCGVSHTDVDVYISELYFKQHSCITPIQNTHLVGINHLDSDNEYYPDAYELLDFTRFTYQQLQSAQKFIPKNMSWCMLYETVKFPYTKREDNKVTFYLNQQVDTYGNFVVLTKSKVNRVEIKIRGVVMYTCTDLVTTNDGVEVRDFHNYYSLNLYPKYVHDKSVTLVVTFENPADEVLFLKVDRQILRPDMRYRHTIKTVQEIRMNIMDLLTQPTAKIDNSTCNIPDSVTL